MKRVIPVSLLLAALPCVAASAASTQASASKTSTVASASVDSRWPRPLIVPVPETVAGVHQPAIGLAGTWQFSAQPTIGTSSVDDPSRHWQDVSVPGELWMQGIRLKQDVEYPYRKAIRIPADFAGQRILLRFDGVYSKARVWVNGHLAGEHLGGFTSWNLDITDRVKPGQPAQIVVGVTDRKQDLSFATGYASRLFTEDTPRLIVGILRGVRLVALPPSHLTHVRVDTDLDDAYRNAMLKIDAAAAVQGSAPVQVRLALHDPDGRKVALGTSSIALDAAHPERQLAVPVTAPRLWDAEHPNLYRLDLELRQGDRVLQRLVRHVGFREITRAGNRLLVNGKPVKLRGVNRHNADPLLGRAASDALDERDMRLFKQANINYIRTSHYPTTQHFLDLADRYGMYIDKEMPIVWLGHGASDGVNGNAVNEPARRDEFLRPISEAIERDAGHPSILIWSLENESTTFGINFQAERDYAHRVDPTRPLKVGHSDYRSPKHPDYIGGATEVGLDLETYHYPETDADFAALSLPRLYDEYAHVPDYSIPQLLRDPGIRNYWGDNLDRQWTRIFDNPGLLGGGIWSGIDDVFEAPDNIYGYGEWGIIDGWRRPKPEYWEAKKAFSPIRIAEQPLAVPAARQPLRIPVTNRFDHTDLREIAIHWQCGERKGTATAALAPHARGELVIPGVWHDGDVVQLRFERRQTNLPYLIDAFALHVGKDRSAVASSWTPAPGAAPRVEQDAHRLVLRGKDFELVFDKTTGQIVSGDYRGQRVLRGGPRLNAAPMDLPAWSLTSFTTQAGKDAVTVRIAGHYGQLGADFTLKVYGDGTLDTDYRVHNPPAAKKYDEFGLAFDIDDASDRLQWHRKGLWSVYPDDHIGRNQGIAVKQRAQGVYQYRQAPTWSWSQDMDDPHLRGKDHPGFGMTNDYRSQKANVLDAAVFRADGDSGLRIVPDGQSAVRVGERTVQSRLDDQAQGDAIRYQGKWRRDLKYGDYQGGKFGGAFDDTLSVATQKGDSVEFGFTGTYVAWIGPRASDHGQADVYLDGKRVAQAVDTWARRRFAQQMLFERSGLTPGRHTLRIVATGAKQAASHGIRVGVDAFATAPASQRQELLINRSWRYDLTWGALPTGYEAPGTVIKDGFEGRVRLRLQRVAPAEPDKASEIAHPALPAIERPAR